MAVQVEPPLIDRLRCTLLHVAAVQPRREAAPAALSQLPPGFTQHTARIGFVLAMAVQAQQHAQGSTRPGHWSQRQLAHTKRARGFRRIEAKSLGIVHQQNHAAMAPSPGPNETQVYRPRLMHAQAVIHIQTRCQMTLVVTIELDRQAIPTGPQRKHLHFAGEVRIIAGRPPCIRGQRLQMMQGAQRKLASHQRPESMAQPAPPMAHTQKTPHIHR